MPYKPTPITRRSLLQSVLAATCAAAGLPARAAEYGVLFGFDPGPTGVPLMPELLKEMHGRYEPDLGPKVNIVTGNSGAAAMNVVHHAVVDGGTVLLTPSSLMTLLPQLRKLPGLDPVADFVPVASLAELSTGFVVGRTVPASVKSMKEFIGWARENPLQASFGTPGLGTVPHLVGLMMADEAGVPTRPVHYKNMFSMVEDLRSGSVPAGFMPVELVRMTVASGHARLLAVTSELRWLAAPEVPTLRELGLLAFSTNESFAFFISARTPPEKVRELAAAIRLAQQSPPLQAAMAAAQLRPPPLAHLDFAAAVARERADWALAIKRYHLSLEA